MRDWLINIRKLQGLTQKEVADACGITRSCYAGYEQGVRSPKGKKAKEIGEYLGFNWTLFFEELGHKTRSFKKESA
jgi:transcriptional regulator with XRE-family HTH domain